MALEDAADRLAMLDVDELAVAVTVTPVGGGAARTFPALFDAPGTTVELGDDLRAATLRPSLFGLEGDVGALVVGDAIAVAGRPDAYTVADPPEPDGTGFARVALGKAWD
ncbi:MAG: hypothetical protein DCC71_02955 [Proteobacteria bacterium]|nr:MAG: hypothetical protein DCC71_02955 [Pseudomonadota bacterium]